MSTYLTALAWRTRGTSGNTRLALLALADAADETGKGTLAVTDLAVRLGASEKTAGRALASLQKDGLLIPKKGDDYQLDLPTEGMAIRNVPYTAPQEPAQGQSDPDPGPTLPKSQTPAEKPAQALYGRNASVKIIASAYDLASTMQLPAPTPLYWDRHVHHDDFQEIAQEFGQDLEPVAKHLAGSITEPIRRLKAVLPEMRKARAQIRGEG